MKKRTFFLAMVTVLLAEFSLFGCVASTKRAPATKVILPKATLSEGIKAFSGVWEGEWAIGGASCKITVEKINSETVNAVISMGTAINRAWPPANTSYFKGKVVLENGKYFIIFDPPPPQANQAKMKFWTKNGDRMEGDMVTPKGHKYSIILHRSF